MRLSKTISALFLSFVILFASLTQANAKRLHAAIADWTGGIITCEVAVAILEREMGYKIKFPLAIPSLVIGFNQTVIMAFAMQIVTPLIGGKGLGLEVFNGLARSDTGRGLAAGIGIVLLAIIIDRISLAWTKKQREALGL